VYKESSLSRAGVSSSIDFVTSNRLHLRVAEKVNALVRYSVLVMVVFAVFTIFTTA
jgi:hypothetical protein